jgi:hypothetical protein
LQQIFSASERSYQQQPIKVIPPECLFFRLRIGHPAGIPGSTQISCMETRDAALKSRTIHLFTHCVQGKRHSPEDGTELCRKRRARMTDDCPAI